MATKNRKRRNEANRASLNKGGKASKPGSKSEGSAGSKKSSRIVLWAGLAIVTAAVVVVGVIAGTRNNDTSSNSSSENGQVARAEVPAASERDRAPDIEGPTIDGKRIKLSDFRGKPTVVHVWASWCEICREEAEDISELMKDHPEVNFVGLDVQDSASDAEAYIDEFDWREDAPHFDDFNRKLAAELGFTGQPNSMVVDKDGLIVQSFPGATTKEQFESVIEALKS